MESEQLDAGQKPRVTNACEACRAAKVKCEASSTLGICRRCQDSKRECVFKTGPRTRRPRQSKLNPAAPRAPPPPGPSKTFTIDIPMPADEDVADSFDVLREQHEMFLERLIPEDERPPEELFSESDMPSGSWTDGGFSALSATPSSGKSRSVHGFSIRPQFNLDSAESLLQSFRDMLTHFPVIVLPDDVTVPSLARDSPFVLLAILSAASGSRTLQGHTLYDEEFRKVLGLKFVAGGERSLELLQGLLVYCAWYPFHLRPKNRQALQYIRMAADIVRDLDLDQPMEDDITLNQGDTERIAGIRAYLACYYLSTNFSAAWGRVPKLRYSEWTTTCSSLLGSNEQNAGDRLLAWLVRMEHLMEEVSELTKNKKHSINEYQTSLLMKGMETQLREWQSNMPPDISSTPTLTMSNLFTEMYIFAAPLLRMPNPKHLDLDQPGKRVSADRLRPCINILRTFFEYVIGLPPSEFANFCGMDWDHFVVTIILALRLSFPLPVCPEWDAGAARRELNLGYYLDQLSREEAAAPPDLTPSSSSKRPADVLSASRVVLGVVKRKWDRRLAAMNPPHPPVPLDKTMSGCPMLDGSLDPYIQLWDEDFINTKLPSTVGSVSGAGGSNEASQPAVYHDLWATMTLGWTREGMDDIDFGNI